MVTANCGSGPDASEPVTGARGEGDLVSAATPAPPALPALPGIAPTEHTFTGPRALHGQPPAAELPTVTAQTAAEDSRQNQPEVSPCRDCTAAKAKSVAFCEGMEVPGAAPP